MTYTGTVYNDLNGNGVIASGRSGPAGLDGRAARSNGNIVATTTSAADGSYSFANLGYGVVHDRGDHYRPAGTRPSLGSPSCYTVTATSGASQSGLDFGNFQLVNVTGNVYNDLNGNGNLDPGEPGLQGWTVDPR